MQTLAVQMRLAVNLVGRVGEKEGVVEDRFLESSSVFRC